MDAWGVAFLTAFLCLAAAFLLSRIQRRGLPPGPLGLPFLGNLLLFVKSRADYEFILNDLFPKYGPIVALRFPSHLSILVADRNLAHEMLVQHGAIFADRPSPSPAYRVLSSNQYQINTAAYGPRWRLFRRNFAADMLNPSRVRQCAGAREWALRLLFDEFHAAAHSADGAVVPKETFQFAMFSLLVFLCVGERLDEAAIRQIEAAQRDLLSFVPKLNVFDLAPKISMYLFRGRWNHLLHLRQRQRDIFLPLIGSRRKQKGSRISGENTLGFSYLDSLLDLEIPDENGRKLDDEEIISLCSEFLNAGTDTTSTALEWIMANVVNDPRVQEQLAEEVGEKTTEDDLRFKPYLKAVILEGLRRHPPAYFVIPHAVTEEITLGGYTIPKGAVINFAVGKMHLDGETWPDPLEFRPERFLPGGEGEGADITGSKKIQMMPFGAGRRVCPAIGLAMLHLEYFVANLVGKFRWEAAEGGQVDLSERPEFTMVMRNPLRARITARRG